MTEPAAGWSVIINETASAYLGRDIVQILPADSFEHAVSVAECVAVNHMPQHSMNVNAGMSSDRDTWTVQVQGSTRTYYFTATIARWTGTYPQ